MAGVNGRLHFDAYIFDMKRYSGNHAFIYDSWMNKERLTGVGAWAGLCQHCNSKGAIGSSAVGAYVDSPFFRYDEDQNYKVRLVSLLDVSCAGEVNALKLSLRLICYDIPLKTRFWTNNFGFWAKDLGSKVWLSTCKGLPVFSGRQNAELYAIPLHQHLQAHVPVPP